MRSTVLSKEGRGVGEIDLPSFFEIPLRLDIIKKSFTISRRNGMQPHSAKPTAGKEYSVEWWGKGRGVSRTPRIKGTRRGAFAPNTVGGRRAHPPTAEKSYKRKINRREGELAIKSAISATAVDELVRERGHLFKDDVKLPIVVQNDFSRIGETKDMLECLRSLGLEADLERSANGRHIRAGKGKARGRRYRVPRSVLIVSHRIPRGAKNLLGVDVVKPETLGIEELAPGGNPGRLTIWTEEALKALEERF